MEKKITINEQSSIRIAAEKIIYFDPYKITDESHDADIIFFTHPHHDHFSQDDFKKVAKEETIFVAPATMEKAVLDAGVKKDKTVAMKPADNIEVMGIQIEAVPAYNIGKPMHPKKNGWLGYVITVENTAIYVCGDTDEIPEGKAVTCDIVIVPIGGFFTMNAEDAAAFVNEIRPKVAIPSHYGSLIGSKEDAEKFKQSVDDAILVSTKMYE